MTPFERFADKLDIMADKEGHPDTVATLRIVAAMAREVAVEVEANAHAHQYRRQLEAINSKSR